MHEEMVQNDVDVAAYLAIRGDAEVVGGLAPEDYRDDVLRRLGLTMRIN